MASPLQVYSEIGPLKKVLLHRPGQEIENMTPKTMETLLFDDIPYAEVAMKEHDAFATTLQKAGVQVLYFTDLLAESLRDRTVRENFLSRYILEIDFPSPERNRSVMEFLTGIDDLQELCGHLIAGLTLDTFPDLSAQTLTDLSDESIILTQPMPNLYFMRDPLTVIGEGVSIHRMYTRVRNRETLLTEQIFTHHPVYGDKEIPHWYEREETRSLEGGDILVLSEDTVMIGISQRTHPGGIETVARRLLADGGFRRVIAVKIPKVRAFMHLDTVLTQVDYDKFVIHPEIEPTLKLFELTLHDGALAIEESHKPLAALFADILGQTKVSLIPCAGGHPIHAPREQWNDGSNTLCIKPGEVVVYARNYYTNDLLDRHGIKLHEIDSSELSRGRGGPRCMSMPFVREPIK